MFHLTKRSWNLHFHLSHISRILKLHMQGHLGVIFCLYNSLLACRISQTYFPFLYKYYILLIKKQVHSQNKNTLFTKTVVTSKL